MQLLLWTCVTALLLGPIDCSRIRRVVGGEVLPVGDWPWLVSLHYKQSHAYLELQGLRHLCAGTLINRYWVLTAAHCLHKDSGSSGLGDPSNWIAVLGEYNRMVNESTEQHLDIENIFLSPNYALLPNLTGDIALMQLRTPAVTTSAVSPIGLDSNRQIAIGTTCKAAGWGQHDSDQYGNGTLVPHVVELERVDQPTCRAAYEWPLIDDTVMCFASEQGKDTCQGDSGGPLVCQNQEGTSVVSGVVSVGARCADADYPGVYTRVCSYLQWINTIMALNPTP